jgi:hypothetical protein
MANETDNKPDAEGFPPAPRTRALLDESAQQKLPFCTEWDGCLLALKGRQWVRWSTARNRWYMPERSHQTRFVVNLILNIYRHVLARLAVGYPATTVMPASPSTEDTARAIAAKFALQHFWHAANMRRVLRKAAQWLTTSGNVALHTYYNPDTDAVATDAVSPYDIFFEPGVNSHEASAWIAIRSYHRREDLRAVYTTKDQRRIIDGADVSGATNANETNDGRSPTDERVELYEFYWQDTTGRHAVMCGHEWLFKRVEPVKLCPVQFVRYTEVNRDLWGIGLIHPLVDINVMYNAVRSQMHDNVIDMANPKWLCHMGAGVASDAFRNKVGEVIYWQGAIPPQQVQGSPMPGYVGDHERILQLNMMDVAGLHSVSFGKPAVGIESGRAISAMRASDTSQLQLSMEQIEDAVGDLAVVVLALMREYYTEARQMSIFDHTGRTIHRLIKSADLTDAKDVIIQAGSLFRDEAQDREQRLLDLLQLGAIDQKTYEEESQSFTWSRRSMDRMGAMAHAMEVFDAWLKLDGVGIEIFLPDDDLKVWQDLISSFMRSPAYYELPPEKQEYLRDLLVSVITHPAGDEAYEQASARTQVFPKKDRPPTPTDMARGPEALDENEAYEHAQAQASPGPGGGAHLARAAEDINKARRARSERGLDANL